MIIIGNLEDLLKEEFESCKFLCCPECSSPFVTHYGCYQQKGKDYKFSGILCLDEVFFTNCGKKVCGLMAIDPEGPYLVGFKRRGQERGN